jgi:Zn-dependent protease with chaperone function
VVSQKHMSTFYICQDKTSTARRAGSFKTAFQAAENPREHVRTRAGVALPGGIIVITNDMVKMAQSQQKIAAVSAQEIGHVELGHSLLSFLQQPVSGAATAAVISEGASVSVAVATVPNTARS